MLWRIWDFNDCLWNLEVLITTIVWKTARSEGVSHSDRKDLFWLTVSVRGWLNPSLWAWGEAGYHDGRNMAEGAYLMAARTGVTGRGKRQDIPLPLLTHFLQPTFHSSTTSPIVYLNFESISEPHYWLGHSHHNPIVSGNTLRDTHTQKYALLVS
jgi:hypothetical protein